jgi:hypothetical protein
MPEREPRVVLLGSSATYERNHTGKPEVTVLGLGNDRVSWGFAGFGGWFYGYVMVSGMGAAIGSKAWRWTR